ncbi:MAG: type II toxin-antitoxin system HicA family toxin [Candidatus Diapherotrites archaeon]|nr:type II toxin-antitoxin system HicA family toxin [Candidatus Diapherotrites archaeon]
MPDSVKLRRVLRALHKLGFKEIRQKGSHVFFEHSDGRTTMLPMHKEIRIKLLTKIIKQDMKITKKEFFEKLEQKPDLKPFCSTIFTANDELTMTLNS